MTATTAIDHAGAGVQATGEPVEPATADPGLDLVLVSEQAQAWRTRRDERLEHLFEERCDWIRAYGNREHLAVDSDELRLTYDQLDQRANQLARYLWMRGVSPGDRVALLFDQPAYSYVAMLAVLKIGAAYVPLDVSFPTDRMAYICQDARVSVVLTMSAVLDKVDDLGQVTGNGAEIVYLDQQAALIAEMNSQRLIAVDWRADREQLAYIIYTSGSTGKPKGVAIDHPSICNFVRVAAEMYGIKPQDRVYQGLTIAFDFSFEEIWVPWVSGATLVPKQAGRSMLGDDLHQFLTERRVTALCCVPTLLATLERDLPRLRFLLVSGEACPQDLVARWYRAGRRFLNVYGPTEATVTATWTEVRPDKPVTIGVPLPTYATVILDVDNPYRALPHGEVGEIGIAGIGLACGYLNRDDLTEKAFITDFLGIPGNQSGRIYRTGDLGRVNQDGEIEYLGRIDLQVKIRGYRIELTEIESVLLQVPGVAQAVVSTYQPNPETTELVGYYSLRGDTAHLDQSSVYAVLREQLPAYMVPAYLEQLDAIPMTPQDKADRKNLPAPRQRGQLAAGEHIAPTTEAERALASALAGVLGVAEVSVDSHFFDQLGANSLVMAQFTSRARKLAGMPPISMKDVYQSPTIRQLAAAGGGARAAVSPGAQVSTLPERVRASSLGYALTGVVQALLFVVAAYLSAQVLTKGFSWIAAATTIPMALERAAGLTVGSFAAASIVPVLAKWVLVGRWRPGTIRLWSAGYVRFWLVKTLIQNSPMVAFAGSPLFVYYLRALGARVGRGATIHSRTVPVVTDLISFGAGAVIRRDCSYAGYRAVNGVLQLGPVTVGRHAHIGESTVLDINTELGDDATLGHSSALHSGQSVPARQTWHGCPAVPTDTDYRTCPPVRYRATRTVLYSLAQLLLPLVAATAALGLGSLGLSRIPALHGLLLAGNLATGWTWYLLVAAVSLVLFVGGIGAGLIMVMVVPRL
ncbi:MAG TPA: amino acid adenylation domain-containing protein, partial [Pseudonocardia sp.]